MNRLVSFVISLSYPRIVISAIMTGVLIGAVTVTVRILGRPARDIRLGDQSIGTVAPAAPQITKRPPGPVPLQSPRLTRVFPWVGKAGDIVIIDGEHFGDNPKEKQLSIGGIAVTETQILDWTDQQIQAFIPAGAAQGGTVDITIGAHPSAISLPIALYDTATRLQLKKTGTAVVAASLPDQIRIVRWWGDLGDSVQLHEASRTDSSDPALFDTQGEEILSLLLFDSSGAILPYFVDPEEFGF